jgi:hypothetical protein
MITKKYTIEFTQDDKGKFHSTRINDGFNGFEILGMLETTKIQINEILIGKIEIPIENTKRINIDRETPTIDYVIKNCDISERLKSALIEYEKEFKVAYLEDVDPRLMMRRVRGAGYLTISQLKELKEKLLL